MRSRLKALALTLVLAAICVFGGFAQASEKKFPSRPIEFICPFTPGGSADFQARVWSRYMEKYLGTSVVPINKPGAGGVVGASIIANSRPDGYTVGTVADFLVTGVLGGQATYKLEDFRIIAEVSRVGCVLAVPADSQWKTFQDFVDYARKHPGVKLAHQGTASIIYMRAENLNKMANLKMIPLPFKGDGEIVAALLGKHAPIGSLSASAAVPLVEAGKLRILFSFDPPQEIGLDHSIPDFATVFGKDAHDVTVSTYLVGPAGMPKDVVDILRKTMENVTGDAAFVSELKKNYLIVKYVDGDTVMTKKIPEKIPIIKTIMKDAGLMKQ
jgi:tripartite-type tricarboxylate transporter receptor subunit TctC